ncbi:S8 family serine peptidase [Flavihumibacter fluvii]|uniref:S8 family serine peptidase n=1 Tax=Flavihumibacter fluvii TaxID=2838157 RepID=UPI001BDE4266|nr:S8 family serine peptidase [Flavihumibacter fluvii]ULQ54002.1 S8 family serine peptidase [Flavihumibacter fluvii]
MIRALCLPRMLFVGMLSLSIVVLHAQAVSPVPIYFKKGMVQGSVGVHPIDPASSLMKVAALGNMSKVFLQFKTIPDSRKIQQLKARGIDLLEYIPENTYLANVKGKWSDGALKELGIMATIPLTRNFKNPQATVNPYALSRADTSIAGKYHLVVSPDIDTNQLKIKITTLLAGKQDQSASLRFLNTRLAEMNLSPNTLEQILDQPYILYAMPVQPLVALNGAATDRLTAQAVQRGSSGMPGLHGKGIVMGIGDDGRIDHIDNGYYVEGQNYNSSYHATHVAGTMVGAGVINPNMKGFAPEATLLVDYFNTIIYRVPEYYPQKRLVLTNNSYGAGSYCIPYSGEYSGFSGQVDQQLLDYPNLMHVFAAGNSGSLQCGDFPAGYRTIDNSFQAAKNVITVGGTSQDGLSNKFSRGPVNDGRIKPEISGIGNAMLSTITGNAYGSNQGTSMSTPQVTGALALVYERYRQLNGDLDPPGDLAKAIICNTATDIGNKGVDFSTGFGWLNLKKAIDVVNDKSYRAGMIEQGGEQVIEILLDKEVFDFKVMLYWHDQPSSYYTLKNLVNDLDLTVQLPDGSTYDPMVLDTSAIGVTKPAVMGKDHMNNIEQVVIEHALPGRYAIRVKAYKIPFGPQAYKIVYNWQEAGLQLIQPVGGEQWKPGEVHGIHWQDGGHAADLYSFDYSLDGGNEWTNIPGITGTYNRVDWTIPKVQSPDARIRVTNTMTGQSVISAPFVIFPEISFNVKAICSSTVAINWQKPAGIDSVVVLLFKDGEYEQQAITTDTSWMVTNLQAGPAYWMTVQPVLAGKPGERSIAKRITTTNVPCAGSGLAGDMMLKNILLPPTSRENSSSATGTMVPLNIQLENAGVSVITDSVFLTVEHDGVLLGRDTLVKFFSPGKKLDWATRLSFAAIPGTTAHIHATIQLAGDPNQANNQVDSNWRYLYNQPISLPRLEDFSTITDSAYSKPGIIGIPGAEAWDFSNSSAGLTLFTRHLAPRKGISVNNRLVGQVFQLTGTYNLSDYQLTDNIRASISFPNRDECNTTYFIRGDDTKPWVQVRETDPYTGAPGFDNLNISAVLSKANQQPGASFQFRMSVVAASYKQELYMLDSFRLFKSGAELSLTELNADKAFVTDGDSLKIKIGVINNNLTVNGPFDLYLRLPNDLIQSQHFDSLPAGKIITAIFGTAINGWPEAKATFTAWVANPHDSYPGNDTLISGCTYSRKISNFPYLEGFENGAAGWGSSYLYQLSSKLPPAPVPYKAANGQEYWGTNHIDSSSGIAFPVITGNLVSPLFNISQMKNPYLSLSVNKQLCDGKDLVQVQYSIDTGRTWRPLFPFKDATNWYSTDGQVGWTNCGDDYWQVVSAPLPQGIPLIQLQIYNYGTENYSASFPRKPGGLLVDDIHIFDLGYSIFDGQLGTNEVQKNSSGNLSYYTGQNKVIASAFANTETANNTLRLSAPVNQRSFNGHQVLPKSWIFNGTPGNAANNLLRLYFTHEDVKNWLATMPCDTCQLKRSAYELAVFRYAGPNLSINETEADNVFGYEETWTPDAFTLVPYESGYYAEIPAADYGEFYIGLDENRTALQFEASRQPGADIVLLNWTVANTDGIVKYAVERAPRSTGALVFETIGNLQQSGNTGVYHFRDTRINPPGAWTYRLKITYESGDILYSPLRTISFDDIILARLYPNPSRDGLVNLLLQNAEGKKVELALFDQTGRYLWGQSLEPVAQQQLVPLSIGNGRLAKGVYALKITTATEKKTIQLVISGN